MPHHEVSPVFPQKICSQHQCSCLLILVHSWEFCSFGTSLPFPEPMRNLRDHQDARLLNESTRATQTSQKPVRICETSQTPAALHKHWSGEMKIRRRWRALCPISLLSIGWDEQRRIALAEREATTWCKEKLDHCAIEQERSSSLRGWSRRDTRWGSVSAKWTCKDTSSSIASSPIQGTVVVEAETRTNPNTQAHTKSKFGKKTSWVRGIWGPASLFPTDLVLNLSNQRRKF